MSLAGCHPRGSLYAWPTLPHRGSDSTAGWVAPPGAQARALHRPLLPTTLSAAKPLALLPKYPFLIHSNSNEGVLGCILPTQDAGGQRNRQAHPARRSVTHPPSMAPHDFQDKANPEGWSPLSTSNLNSPFRIPITGTGPPSRQPLKLSKPLSMLGHRPVAPVHQSVQKSPSAHLRVSGFTLETPGARVR